MCFEYVVDKELPDEKLKMVLGIFDYTPLREHLKKLLLSRSSVALIFLLDNRITYVGACGIAEAIHIGFPQLDTFDISCLIGIFSS